MSASCPCCGSLVGHYVDCLALRREPIGTVESVHKVDGETIATVRLGAPSDADVEALRRAMVDAHQTYRAIDGAMMCDPTWTGVHDALARARRALVDAARAHEEAVYLAKRARGGL